MCSYHCAERKQTVSAHTNERCIRTEHTSFIRLFANLVPIVPFYARVVRRDQVLKHASVELLDGVVPRVERQLGVEHAGLDAKLFEKELEPVGPVDVVDKDEDFAFDELELEEDVDEQELVFFRASV